jgi:tRNA G37 N-methylase Trm5
MAAVNSTELKVDVEVLKRDVDTLTKLCEKMDTVIEKLVDHQGVLIGQIYKDMDKREDDTNEDIKDLHSRITTTSRELSDKVESTERKIMEQIEKLSLQIKEHNAKEDSELEKILQWKWTIVGGILVLSWLTSHVGLDTIIKLIH